MGPRLCGTCLCDRRSISISAVYVPKKITFNQVRLRGGSGRCVCVCMMYVCMYVCTSKGVAIAPLAVAVEAPSKMVCIPSYIHTYIYTYTYTCYCEAGRKTVISMSTHCNVCGFCVIDVDHHCMFLGLGRPAIFVILNKVHVCMYVCIHVNFFNQLKNTCMYDICTYVQYSVFMYVCIYVCICVHIYVF